MAADRSAWLTSHVDHGHGITRRADYDECSCGATFWRAASHAATLRERLEQATAQLRHAYLQLTAHDGRWSRRGMHEFADGLIAPQIRKLESVLAALDAEGREDA